MSYVRVIPRDLFNEANLLKCLGQLYLKLESKGHRAELKHNGDAFEIAQDPSDGSIMLDNVFLFVRGKQVPLRRPMNSRDPYPLYAYTSDDEEIPVFNDFGDLTDSFLAFIT